MEESFLHFIWKFQYFNFNELSTEDGDPVYIINQGNYQENSGPDFESCRINIGGIEWAGNIEIHIKSSDWDTHKHQRDHAYDNVILHVVWENDQEVYTCLGHKVPTVELKGRVDDELLLRFNKFINSPNQLACSSHLSQTSDLKIFEMIDKSVARRLARKSDRILEIFEKNGKSWEETAYIVLARNFGFHVNSDSFEQLAKALPYKIIRKHSDQIIQIEALLFGQAGFLNNDHSTEYIDRLRKEYNFLSGKYNLQEKRMDRFQWRFLRLRPANFPTIRIAQLANLLSKNSNIFSVLTDADSLKELLGQLESIQSKYWIEHYDFDKAFSFKSNGVGRKSLENIVVNSVVPLLVSYSKYKNEQKYLDRALNFLEMLPAEDNKIIRMWKEVGVVSNSSFDSQGLLTQYEELCKQRNCLRCSIGADILNRSL